jgi:hypothetical protein
VATGSEVGCGGVVGPVSGLDGGPCQGDGEHGLADAGRADEQDVGGVFEESERGKLADQFLVDARLCVEVEVVQAER